MAGPKVAVVGGSLAGLTTALLLRDAGCEVDVFERTPGSLVGFGAGIILHPASIRYFVERSPITLDQLSVPSRCLRYLDPDGGVRYETESDYRFTAWNALYRGLISCFGEERYHRGEALVGLDQDADGVELRFTSGRIERCDLGVCADGALSTARQRLLGIMPQYAGYIGWRGIVGEDELTPETWNALEGAFTYALSDEGHTVAYEMPTLAEHELAVVGSKLNYTWYRNVPEGPELEELMTDRHGIRRPVSVHPADVQERYVAEMRAAAPEVLPPPLAELVAVTRDPFITAIIDADVPRMAFGRICLLGDAGYLGRPHAAAGGAKACANAWALADALTETGFDVVGALERWEPDQLELGKQLVARTRDMGDRLQFGGPWTPGDPSLRFGLYGPGN